MVLSRSWFLIEPGISPQHVEEILAPFSAAVHSQCSLQREGVDVHIVDMHQEEKHDLVSACCFRADYRKGILIFRNMANDTDPERAYQMGHFSRAGTVPRSMSLHNQHLLLEHCKGFT